jgi:cholesterol transport system auxiliary component
MTIRRALIAPLGKARIAAALAGAMALSGCISFGEDPPPVLFDLTSAQPMDTGSTTRAQPENAIGLLTPNVPAKLAVRRVPVQVDDSSIAYLQEAVWVDDPARLFADLLGQTMRARSGRLVIAQGDGRYTAGHTVSGTLRDMGYDVGEGGVVVRFDATITDSDGAILTRRFSRVVPGIPAEAAQVAPALNQAANEVAVEVADWVLAEAR